MMSSRPPTIDQALDPFAGFFQPTAESYDSYLRAEYNVNRWSRSKEWEAHYEESRITTSRFVWKNIQKTRMKIEETNLAIIGPGFDLVGHEIDHRMVREYLKDLQNIVIIDFSTDVIRSAITSLVNAGVRRDKVHGVLYDITNGCSTVYEQNIRDKFSSSDENQFMTEACNLQDFCFSELDDRWMDVLETRGEKLDVFPRYDIPGSINRERTLKFTLGGSALPIHIATMPMVAAGTGAAAEDHIWERFKEFRSYQSEGRLKTVPTSESEWDMFVYECIHSMISKYNTEVMSRFTRWFMQCNPDATLLAITDVDTIYRTPDFGSMDRLNIPELQRNLKKANIQVSPSSISEGWNWNDEPEHGHRIIPLVIKMIRNGGSKHGESSVQGHRAEDQKREGTPSAQTHENPEQSAESGLSS